LCHNHDAGKSRQDKNDCNFFHKEFVVITYQFKKMTATVRRMKWLIGGQVAGKGRVAAKRTSRTRVRRNDVS
jgi:hypothetical protein